MTPISSSHLANALQLNSRELISLVGGGGKSTLLFQLARTLQGSTIATTTTKMGENQTGGLTVIEGPTFDALHYRRKQEPVFVRQTVRNRKSIGVQPEMCDEWFGNVSLCDNIVVEADGARHRPFKAPANFEPVFPAQTTLVLTSPDGSMKGSPEESRKVVVITKVPHEEDDLLTASLVAELQTELSATIEVVSIEFEHIG